MNVLGIETATDLAGVAFAGTDGRRAEAWTSGRRRHTESLAPMVAHVLEQAGITLSDLAALAVDVGPGLFTGLRVGIATAKGLAQGLDIGVLGLSSLDVLAHGAAAAGLSGRVLAVVDARRGEVFVAHYEVAAGTVSALEPAALIAPAALAEALRSIEEPVLAIGDGARRYGDLLQSGRVRVAGPLLGAPTATMLVDLAVERMAAGQLLESASAIAPLYLRDADARINWVTRDEARSA